jgi:hypothetical protein
MRPRVIGEVFSYVSAFPALVVTLLGGVMLVWRSGIRWTPGAALHVPGHDQLGDRGTGAVMDSTAGLNQFMHNALWVEGHFHGIMAMV